MEVATRRPSFWRRQVTGQSTWPQVVFDVAFGIVFPLVCLIADPIVFREEGALSGRGVLADYALFAYLFIGLQALALAAWLLLGRRLAAGGAWFAGPLAAGAIFAGVVGLAILPLSLIGLLFIIGILGFTPWLTSFVYVRNALRAYAGAGGVLRPAARRLLAVAGLLCSLLPSFAIDTYIRRETEDLLRHPQRSGGLVERWGLIRTERIIDAYEQCPPGPRREALASLYRRLTAEDIEVRLAIRND